MNTYLTRATTHIASGTRLTAFNKPEMKVIRSKMRGFGFKLSTKSEDVLDSVVTAPSVYIGEISFFGKMGLFTLSTTEEKGVFETVLHFSGANYRSLYDVGNTLSSSGNSKELVRDLKWQQSSLQNLVKDMDNVIAAAEFLQGYVGRAKAPKA